MGAGILPTTIHNKKLYFLFGKENKYADTPGWSDFGGGTDNKETHMQTAIREGGEELTGFLGSDDDLKRMLKRGTYNIDGSNKYRMFLFYMPYDETLPHYYNNNQRFLQKHLDVSIIRDTKIFEKTQIKWFCIDDLKKNRKQFRHFYQNIIDLIITDKDSIDIFIRKSLNSTSTKSIKQNYNRKTRKTRKEN